MTRRHAGEVVQRQGIIWRDFRETRVVVDLFRARSVFFGGLEQEIDTTTVRSVAPQSTRCRREDGHVAVMSA